MRNFEGLSPLSSPRQVKVEDDRITSQAGRAGPPVIADLPLAPMGTPAHALADLRRFPGRRLETSPSNPVGDATTLRVMHPVRSLATYEDLLALPEDVRAEIIAGAIITHPSPLPEHSRAQQGLSRAIGGPFDEDDGRGGPGGWWILQEVDVRFGVHDIVRPDISGWRRERLPSPWGVRPIDVVPDWICEVVSPSNEANDRVKKRRLYAAAGIPFYWIVDPAERTLEAMRLVNGVWVDAGSFDEEANARIPPFDSIEIEVARLFPPRS